MGDANFTWSQTPTILGVQDHLDEFVENFGGGLTTAQIVEYGPNKKKREGKEVREDPSLKFQPRTIPFRARDDVFLPQRATSSTLLDIGGHTAARGEVATAKVDVVLRFRATMWPEVTGDRTQPVPPRTTPASDVGFSFHVESREVIFGTSTMLVDANLDKSQQWEQEEVTLPLRDGNMATMGIPRRFLLRPQVKARGFALDGDVRCEFIVRTVNNFTRVDARYLDEVGNEYPITGVPNGYPPIRLVEIAKGRRVFEIEYELKWDRGLAAWYAARREVSDGKRDDAYGERGDWTTTSTSNAGKPLKNKSAFKDDRAFLDRYRDAVHNARPGSLNENWCGTFVGYVYYRAGFDFTSKYKGGFGVGSRFGVFLSALKIKDYVARRGGRILEFPLDARKNRSIHNPAWSEEQCKKWLDENLQRWSPRRGDMIFFMRTPPGESARIGHVALVSKYEMGSTLLYTIEGNNYPRGRFVWRKLSAPKTFIAIDSIARLTESDFDRGIEASLAACARRDDDGLGAHDDKAGAEYTDPSVDQYAVPTAGTK